MLSGGSLPRNGATARKRGLVRGTQHPTFQNLGLNSTELFTYASQGLPFMLMLSMFLTLKTSKALINIQVLIFCFKEFNKKYTGERWGYAVRE